MNAIGTRFCRNSLHIIRQSDPGTLQVADSVALLDLGTGFAYTVPHETIFMRDTAMTIQLTRHQAVSMVALGL